MLTDAECRKAAPGTKERKITDSQGLYLRIKPSGHKTFCWKYRFAGREKKLTLGTYPQLSLKQARAARLEAEALLDTGVDPSAEKKRQQAATALAALDTFEKIARAWHKDRSATLNARYARQILDRLTENVFPYIGTSPISDVTPAQVLEIIRKIEKRSATEMAHRVRLHISDVFTWAIASGLANQDPAQVIRKAMKPVDPKLRPALITLPQVREVLIKTEALPDVYWATHLASRLLALTVARPGVLRLAERKEFEQLDSASPIWRIPASKMKLTRKRKRDASYEFVIPLSHQAVETVKAAMEMSYSPSLLFPSIIRNRKPMSDSTLSKHYREAGLQGIHVPHGWRSSFSTIMNEKAAIEGRESDRMIIDMMLAHVQDGVEPVYNRAAYMPRRREIAQEWADMLMKDMPPASSLLPRF